jgi:hypothetical protein
MKTSFSSWLTAVLVGMAGISCAAQEVLPVSLFATNSIASPDAIAITSDKKLVVNDGVFGAFYTLNPTNFTFLTTNYTFDGFTDFGGQVGNDRVIVARDGNLFEIKQASDYSGSYGSVAFPSSAGVSAVTRGFTNSLGELEAYTIAKSAGVDYFTKINFTTQIATPLPSYGQPVAGFNCLDAYQPVAGATRFVYCEQFNGTNFINDHGLGSFKRYAINFPTNLSSVSITDLAFDPDSPKLYFCFTSSTSGGIGVIENFPKQPATSITNEFLLVSGLGQVVAKNIEAGSRVHLQSASNPAGPYTTIATTNLPINRIGAIFSNLDVTGPRRFFRTAYAP